MTGVIKTFSPGKGYGFIDGTDGNEYWFHASEWMGRDKPQPNDRVEFAGMEIPGKGKRAYIVAKERK